MPISKKPGETKEEFIGRCIPIEIKGGKPQEQAAAICYAYWEEKQLSAVKRIRSKKKKALEFKKTRVYVDSSNVDRVMYDDVTKQMTIKFNEGSIYTYKDVPISLFEDIIDGNGTCISEGSNKWGDWFIGKSPSVGAAVYQRLVEKSWPFERGGDFR